MPQDIPVEASETLDFTPECLAGLEAPPVFRLRAVSRRDKRWLRTIIRDEGAVSYSVADLRAEMLTGLKELWDDAAYAEHAPVLEAYWEALDNHALQAKDDPKLKWDYDPAIEQACAELEVRVAQSWPKLARMRSANARMGELSELALVAIAIRGWSNLKAQAERAGGYLTIDSAEELKDELGDMDEADGRQRGAAWMQLFVACSRRMVLDKDEEKNSASPSPFETPQTSSSPGKGGATGKSPASASSTETPATA